MRLQRLHFNQRKLSAYKSQNQNEILLIIDGCAMVLTYDNDGDRQKDLKLLRDTVDWRES